MGRNGQAVLAMVLASALVAGTSLIAKSLGAGPGGLSPFQVSAGRFCFALLGLAAFVMLKRGRGVRDGSAVHWRWHVMRSIFGWLGVTAMFAAAARMPLAEATAISFLSPLVTMALAVAMLGEHLGLRKGVAAGLAVTGALVILRPGTEAFQPAALYALAAAGLMGAEAVFIKRLSDTEPPLRILLINNTIGASVSLAVASTVWAWPDPGQWGLLVAIGLVMVSAQANFIQAMKRGQASLVIPVFYSVLVFAAFYDAVIFRVWPGALAIAGAGLIVAGAVMLALAPARVSRAS